MCSLSSNDNEQMYNSSSRTTLALLPLGAIAEHVVLCHLGQSVARIVCVDNTGNDWVICNLCKVAACMCRRHLQAKAKP
jgi:hypothetical protein